MKLLSAAQIRQWDQYTIQKEPVSSIDLMERAAKACTKWLLQHTLTDIYYIFCGKGNNGGDGLAIARLLEDAKQTVKVFILESDAVGSADYRTNFNHLHTIGLVPIRLIRNENELPEIPENAILIDALFGTGLYKELRGNASLLAEHMNRSGNAIISIDIPSGMLSDESSKNNTVVKATHTLTFQGLKMAFLLSENAENFGQVHILDINLSPEFLENIETKFYLVNLNKCKSIYKKRNNFSHKGTYGHALLIAGSYGTYGAAVLAAKACIRSGTGLVTCQLPKTGVEIMQNSVAEIMCVADTSEDIITQLTTDFGRYSAIGAGPGMGTHESTSEMLVQLLKTASQPLVLDADALNILSQHKNWLDFLPAHSILTPHPKEFSRLFGETENNFQQIDLALKMAQQLNIIIVLKGHYSLIALPDGIGYFNISGNAGMATAGSGDVLAGILTGLVAQGYPPAQAAILGVFLHGLAGDLAAAKHSMEALIASDIIAEMGGAFHAIGQ